MFIEERQIAIEKVLREEGKVRTRELSEMFQVTEDCIRKDLPGLPAGKRCYRQKKLSCGQEDGDRGQGYDVDQRAGSDFS